MTDIKKKIEEIKLARMGPEYRFVANIFSDLSIRYSVRQPGCTFYLINSKPIFKYVQDGNYFWCHYDFIWVPLNNMIYKKINPDGTYNYYLEPDIKKKMREIIGHFALGYLDLSNLTISMASSAVTDSWTGLKLIKVKPWK